MTHSWTELIAALGATGACCGIGYYGLCLVGVRSFLRGAVGNRSSSIAQHPPISILKPLKGTDPEIFESFRSHCLQDYPEYELIFGVSEQGDPAIPLVRQLQREFPQRSIRLVVCPEALGTNMKVSNLIQMLPEARYKHVIVNDSDICVPQDYLRCIMAAFDSQDDSARVGMVTCMYRGQAPQKGRSTLGSKLEALGISTEFHAGVLAARKLEGGIHFALGSTLAFTHEALDAIGGFLPVVDYLADDFELGLRISQAGYRVELAPVVVDTHVPPYSLGGFFLHQLRWARGMRHSRKRGWAGVCLTFALPWSLLAVIASGSAAWSWAVVAGSAAMRLAVALAVGWSVLRDRQVLRWWYLVPLRDVIGLAVWLASYTGDTVAWRGDEFILKDGKLSRSDREVPVGGD
ncbi:MAG TPA: bacteriohopanetetrol glucosamine biosynthesis glycosyltransferase HpnI [Terriglobales bacterium]|nr:bacteriohopanetetrol glucosamine biosynthesis glycosyltransferase HpnI [Terriglobales bacterium]